VTTSKIIKNYLFTADDNVLAIKITYAKKGSGNLAFDDFSITYGNQTTNYVLQDEPVAGNQLLVENLTPETDYYYNVRSTLEEAVSSVSETVKVTTLLGTGTVTLLPQIIIRNSPEGVSLSGLCCGDIIKVFTLMGQNVFHGKVEGGLTEIPLKNSNVYIISVQHKELFFTTKILR